MLRIIRNMVTLSAQRQYLIPEVLKETRRYAGHSKWANIKHQKEATDAERQRLFTRLSRMIRVAIVEGKSGDPEMNSKLQSVIGQCKRANMPQSTITNSIKSAVSSKGSEESVNMLQIRGPGRCALLVEVVTTHQAQIKNTIASIMKKFGCKYEASVVHEFLEKGVLIGSPLKDSKNILDEATEHAIAASIEEVILDAESGKLKFECSPEATLKAKKALEQQGYVIDSAIVEYLPVTKAMLSDEQLEQVQKFLAKIEALPEVMSVVDNIE